MRKKLNLTLLLIIILIFISQTTTANLFNWRVYQGDKINVFFPEGYEYQAQETFYYLSQYYNEIMELTANQKKPEVNVVIQDAGLQTYGSAMPHIAKVNIYTNQPTTLDSFSPGYKDWFKVLGVHELTHISHLIDDSNLPSGIDYLTGNLFSSNLHSPLWMIEGIAIYGESYIGDDIGRLNDGYYDALIASKVKADQFPSIEAATYNYKEQFPSGHWYLYGGTFFDYLAYEYGEDKFGEFFAEYADYYWAPVLGDLFPALGIDKAAQEVYGSSYPELFAQWQDYEKKRHSDWEIKGQHLAGATGGSIHGLTAQGDKLYFLQERELNYSLNAGRETLLVEYDINNEQRRVLDTFRVGMNNSSLEIKGNKLYYSQTTFIPGYANFDRNGRGKINRLVAYDLTTDRSQEIMKDEFKDYIVLDSGEIIYAKEDKSGFGSEIWSYQNQEREKIAEVEQLIGEIKSYQDQLIVVSKKQGATWDLNYLKLEKKELEPIISSEAIIEQIEVKGAQLYFSAYEQQQSLYQYDLISQDLVRLTEDSYAKQGLLEDEKLYFITVGAEGKELYSKEPKFNEANLPAQRSDRKEIDFAALEIEADSIGWNNFNQLARPHLTALPYLFPFGEQTLGLRGEDVIGMNQYQIAYRDFSHLEVELESKLFAPLSLEFESGYLGGRSTELALDYPIYYSLDHGLTELKMDYDTYLDDDWNFKQSRLNLNSGFNFKRPGLEEISLDYRGNFDHDSREQESFIDTRMDFALWEQGLSRATLANRLGIESDFADHFTYQQRNNLELEFLVDRHQILIDSDDITNTDSQHAALEYEYLRSSDKYKFSSEYSRDRARKIESFNGSIGYEFFDNLNQAWGINKNFSHRLNWDRDSQRNVIGASFDYERLFARNHRLDFSGRIDFIETESDSRVNEYILYGGEVDYKHRLLEVKKGLWNPNLFLADIYGEGRIRFRDGVALSNVEIDSRLNYEYYLLAELGLGMHLNLYPKVGFKVRNGELEPDYELNFQSILNF